VIKCHKSVVDKRRHIAISNAINAPVRRIGWLIFCTASAPLVTMTATNPEIRAAIGMSDATSEG